MPKSNNIEQSPLGEIENDEELSSNGLAVMGASIKRPPNPLAKHFAFWVPRSIENDSNKNQERCLRHENW